ncbi:MAG: tRNA (adenosine(37)-N6)-threonylcarbamoyltransferase complex ATPase subunit type 1 TsaE [Zetaproteobacteria bacterium CG06_land_8_20_14_3_00_59_53]|nr:MAG: tRNA (adenosine(37)-N6)-threonylcarbamoyltransferase complex ATPase subunit type 1 TsaE [Zetaproteobacteria bacterium CG2_30_59_37]PIO90448.1 MAG: tRNA (adenosine(37)-N6)-threonylcarbamoyltransferase complex ATPase subunit type 1 TsaE [Zetaproteobacteria bacterium CG23_combo_of_CG06-09_8_20_14_all_59_86]PIQ65919.1 MAG: tRNA (adenosine(37)-N6)-threonylcarbamoyltransferase complex ATPase subunit type 1 TsaE [Zetaproteobacteria bacterium CG11_big_fil_rev_8_21_14_0_20_59_439]PIU71399.1 MAG: 
MHKRLNSEAETIEFANEMSARLKPGDVVAISGDLGAGKSVLARAMMRALGVSDTALPSPTYTIIQEYEGRGCRVAHMDWYRLSDESELGAIGVREYFMPPWICLIEWPERAYGLLSGSTIHLNLQCIEGAPEARMLEANDRIWT